MTVNHGVPGSSPGGGAKLKDLIPMELGLFVFYHFEGREVYPELVEGSPGGGAVQQSNKVYFVLLYYTLHRPEV
jgi:hypothetical protein